MKKIDLENNLEFYNIIRPIIDNEEFKKRNNYKHHDKISVYDHCISVSYISYRLAKRFKIDYKVAAIAGLLHDFYYNPWLDENGNLIKKNKPFLKQHGFVHAGEALENSLTHFPDMIDKKAADAIKKHMFPLNKAIPRYKESWVIILADKYVSFEIFKNPLKLMQYSGIKVRK